MCFGGGAWAGNEHDARVRQGYHALGVDHDRCQMASRFALGQQHRFSLGGHVLVAPGQDRHHHGKEIAAFRGQDIFVARRPLAIETAFEKPGFGQM